MTFSSQDIPSWRLAKGKEANVAQVSFPCKGIVTLQVVENERTGVRGSGRIVACTETEPKLLPFNTDSLWSIMQDPQLNFRVKTLLRGFGRGRSLNRGQIVSSEESSKIVC
jgi:hypothetical protein